MANIIKSHSKLIELLGKSWIWILKINHFIRNDCFFFFFIIRQFIIFNFITKSLFWRLNRLKSNIRKWNISGAIPQPVSEAMKRKLTKVHCWSFLYSMALSVVTNFCCASSDLVRVWRCHCVDDLNVKILKSK